MRKAIILFFFLSLFIVACESKNSNPILFNQNDGSYYQKISKPEAAAKMVGLNAGLYKWGIVAVNGVAALIILVSSIFTVEQQSTAVVSRFGKFRRTAAAGLHMKWPLIESVEGRPSLRVTPLDVKVETKTKDNVFVHIVVSVQYFVIPEKVFEAFYKLRDPTTQISSYVFDVVRAEVPKIELDTVFEQKETLAQSIKKELEEAMKDFGYGILQSLITDIDPNEKVKASMNEINAAQRLRVAANEKGEADKIIRVKGAEAEALSKKLQGEGIANQRKAIISGLQESVGDFSEKIGVKAEDVMSLILLTQYFDTLQAIGSAANSKAVFLPHSPAGLSDIRNQMVQALVSVKE